MAQSTLRIRDYNRSISALVTTVVSTPRSRCILFIRICVFIRTPQPRSDITRTRPEWDNGRRGALRVALTHDKEPPATTLQRRASRILPHYNVTNADSPVKCVHVRAKPAVTNHQRRRVRLFARGANPSNRVASLFVGLAVCAQPTIHPSFLATVRSPRPPCFAGRPPWRPPCSPRRLRMPLNGCGSLPELDRSRPDRS